MPADLPMALALWRCVAPCLRASARYSAACRKLPSPAAMARRALS